MRKALARAKQKSPQLAVGSGILRWHEEEEKRAKTMKTVSLSARLVMMGLEPIDRSGPYTNPVKQLQTAIWEKWEVMTQM
jgi:hypothetical protein